MLLSEMVWGKDYNPAQPGVAAGDPKGGQFASRGGGHGSSHAVIGGTSSESRNKLISLLERYPEALSELPSTTVITTDKPGPSWEESAVGWRASGDKTWSTSGHFTNGKINIHSSHINAETVLHEIGHAVTEGRFGGVSDDNPIMRRARQNLYRISRMPRVPMGLRDYSFSSPRELMADTYKVYRMGTSFQKDALSEAWGVRSLAELFPVAKVYKEGAFWPSLRWDVLRAKALAGLTKAYNPNQVRAPVGSPEGGRWVAANDEDNSFYNSHKNLFDAGGNILPEYKQDYDRATPLRAARDKFTSAWHKGEDGITEYSKAWAKDGVFCETVAEMSKAYFTAHGKYLSSNERWKMAEENVRQIAAGSGAVHLGAAFNAAMRAFRKAGKKGVVSRKAPLIVATQPTFYKAKGKTVRKFFFLDGRESLPTNADYAVELVVGDDGRVVSSTRYVVRHGV